MLQVQLLWTPTQLFCVEWCHLGLTCVTGRTVRQLPTNIRVKSVAFVDQMSVVATGDQIDLQMLAGEL